MWKLAETRSRMPPLPQTSMLATSLSIKARAGPTRPALTASRRPRPAARRGAPLRTLASVSDVGKYLSEAASQIFYPTRNNVPWKTSAVEFTGRITHHEEVPRLRNLLKEGGCCACRQRRPRLQSFSLLREGACCASRGPACLPWTALHLPCGTLRHSVLAC